MMQPVPGRLGGLGAGACRLLTPRLPPPIPSAPIRSVSAAPWPALPVVGDVWGAVQIPAQPFPQIVGYGSIPGRIAPQGSGIMPPGDPALAYTLSYLYSWLIQDSNANAPWQQAFGYPLIKSPASLFTHNPKEADFNTEYLPALYLWRDDDGAGKFEREADDWEVETSTWLMLWALPLGDQFRLKDRVPYANQFVKAVVAGIERNRTPSWVMPNDPVANSATYGSQLGQYTNMIRFRAISWKRSKIRIAISNIGQATGGHTRDFPAVEIRFEARERLKPDIRRFYPLNQLNFTTNNPVTGGKSGHEIDD